MTKLDAHFSWQELEAIVDGFSTIDSERLRLSSMDEAERFLECYGFDWHVPSQRAEIESIRLEALEYITDELIDDLEIDVDPRVRAQQDVRQLLLWASETAGAKSIQRWSCSLLRVMHTFAHAQSYFNDRYGDQIRQQIFGRFEPHLGMRDEGLVLGDKPGIPLMNFDLKPSKPTSSVVAKLLHKVENVAADVFDRIGIRFVTKERFDALLVVRYLNTNNVVTFANVKASRSRNTLVDMPWLREEIHRLDALVSAQKLSPREELIELRKAARGKGFPAEPEPSYNLHSSRSYHSIQFTCRQLIRLDDGLRFFFPFEVQILDEESYLQSRSGLASHELYKDRQREAVRRRVLGPLIGKDV